MNVLQTVLRYLYIVVFLLLLANTLFSMMSGYELIDMARTIKIHNKTTTNTTQGNTVPASVYGKTILALLGAWLFYTGVFGTVFLLSIPPARELVRMMTVRKIIILTALLILLFQFIEVYMVIPVVRVVEYYGIVLPSTVLTSKWFPVAYKVYTWATVLILLTTVVLEVCNMVLYPKKRGRK